MDEKKEEVKENSFLTNVLFILFVIITFSIVVWALHGMTHFESFYIKNKLVNEPCFIDVLEKRGYEVVDVGWFSAKKQGNHFYEYYLHIKEIGWDEQSLKDYADYWAHATNGYVYYDSKNHHILFDLIKFEKECKS